MSDYKEVSVTSWGTRIKNAISGIFIGFLLFLASFYILWWNEGNSVKRIKTLNEGRSLVTPVSADQIDPANNKNLVHIAGRAETNQILRDPYFGVAVKALKLKRVVEMYQWQENKKTKTTSNTGGSQTTETTYSYQKIWSQNAINSGEFKKPQGHENPAMRFQQYSQEAKDIKIGAFQLSKPFTAKINNFTPYHLTEQNYKAINGALKNRFILNGNEYYSGTPDTPQIGDVRIRIEIIEPQEYSAVGQQYEQMLNIYNTKSGKINLIESGYKSADDLFQTAEDENVAQTWLTRFGGLFMMWAGIFLILKPLQVLADVVPIIGSIVGAGASLIAIVLALPLSLLTIALSWIFFRPLIGAAILVVTGFFFFGGFKILKKKAIKEGRVSDQHLSAETSS